MTQVRITWKIFDFLDQENKGDALFSASQSTNRPTDRPTSQPVSQPVSQPPIKLLLPNSSSEIRPIKFLLSNFPYQILPTKFLLPVSIQVSMVIYIKDVVERFSSPFILAESTVRLMINRGLWTNQIRGHCNIRVLRTKLPRGKIQKDESLPVHPEGALGPLGAAITSSAVVRSHACTWDPTEASSKGSTSKASEMLNEEACKGVTHACHAMDKRLGNKADSSEFKVVKLAGFLKALLG